MDLVLKRLGNRKSGCPLRFIFFFCLLLSFFESSSQAWIRTYVTDYEVAQRADSVVIGHLEDGTIQRIKHPVNPVSGGMSWEHHATLIITEVLKGDAKTGETPFIIHYGLDPVVVDISKVPYSVGYFQGPIDGVRNPKLAVVIADTGGGFGAPSDDALRNLIWCLRKENTGVQNHDATNAPGIWEPQDIQRLNLKPFYQALLSDDPDRALHTFLSGDAALAKRAQGSLDYLAVQRIGKIPDPSIRVDQLMPYYLTVNGDYPGNVRLQAREKIMACGSLAAKKLSQVFFDAKPAYVQSDIMAFWQTSNYKEATPVVVELLKREDQFWSTQDMHDKTWYPNVPDPVSAAKNDSFNKILFAIGTLNVLGGDKETRDAVEMTKKRWEANDPSYNAELIRKCDQWLGTNK